MAVTINASTSAGLVQTADTTGNLNLQSNGTTIAALTSTGLAVTGAGTFSTTLGVTGTSTLAAVNASGIFTTSDTTAATSAITGSIKTAGGLGVLKGIFAGSSSSRGTIDITGTSGAGPSLTFNDNQSGAQTYITGAVAANEYDIFDSTRGAYVFRATNTGAVTIPGTLGVTGTGQVGTTLGVGAATPSASGAGITFPATQSASTDANTLDDYEEGTFTPVWTNLTVVGTPTYSAIYTKIGRKVFCEIGVASTVSTASTIDVTSFSGLPFSCGAVRSVMTATGSGGSTSSLGTGGLITTSGNPPTWSANSLVNLAFNYTV